MAEPTPGSPAMPTIVVQPPAARSSEWIWIAVDSWEFSQVRGRIAEIPRRTFQPCFGETVEIDIETQLVDWWIRFPGGKTEGHFLSLASESR